MSFANHNILDIALSIIPPTVVEIRKTLGTKVNKYGQAEASYTEWINVYGIVQPSSERNEHIERIDISKKHISIWLRGITLDGTHLEWTPDQIKFMGRIYNVIDVDDWFPYDNYRKCECVEVLNLPENQRSKGAKGAQKEIENKNRKGTRKLKEDRVEEREEEVKITSLPAPLMLEDREGRDNKAKNPQSTIRKKAKIRI